MSEGEYRDVWRRLDVVAHPEKEDTRSNSCKSKSQDCMNEAFNSVNMLIAGSLIVSLDDDKKKASIGKGKSMQGLKQYVLLVHCKGIIGHTVVCPATLLTLGVCWEMEGESSHDCYVKFVNDIFGIDPNLPRSSIW
jgi:hypothetical protein